MASQAQIAGVIITDGIINCTQVLPSAACISNAMIATPALPANAIDPAKLRCRDKFHRCLKDHGSAPTALRTTLAEVRGTAGSVVRFEAGVVQAISANSVTVDLYKNGSSILTSVITLNTSGGTGGTAYDTVAATVSNTTLAQGDTLEAVVAVSTPSGGGGLWCMLTLDQDPS